MDFKFFTLLTLGCVHDLMKTDQQYHLAVEVTAESRLFYHVVTNDQVAMKILEQINSREVGKIF
jgi:chromosome segregation ATPase